MKWRQNLLLCLLLLAAFLPATASASWFGSDAGKAPERVYTSLADMADAMAKEMKEGHAGMGLRLYLDREDIREDQAARAVPFAGMLVNELERAFSRVGYIFEGRNIDQADYAMVVSYHRTPAKVTVFLKLRGTRNDSYRNLKGTYELAADRLSADCFVETLDAKLARLAQKVSRGWNRAGTLSVAMNPIVEARKKYSSPFSDYATLKIKASLSDLPYFRIVEDRPVVSKGATRSIAKDIDPASSGALLAGADAVLEGVYLRGAETITMSVSLKDLKGQVLANGDENIPRSLVGYSTDNDTAETLSRIADTEHERNGAVRISTVKGGSYQVFREGETVSFTIQVTRPLFVYVYDINPDGGVSLLYPRAGEGEQPRQPGIIYTLPEASDPWEIKVEPPFGKDAVKVFASDRRLPLPKVNERVASRSFSSGTRALARVDKIQAELAVQPAINGLDLVDWYKGTAARLGATLHESTVYVETLGR